MNKLKRIDWSAWIFTLALIVLYRELSVWAMGQVGHPELGNLVGLVSLLVSLIIVRNIKRKLPNRMIDVSNKVMKESSFAFLPICAGSVMILVHMGHEIPSFLLILVVSTLIPLWIYAKLAKHWL